MAMTSREFHISLGDPSPPAGLPPLVAALWWEGKGNWEQAHEIAQSDENGKDAAWVHAYLHRRQGDISNAGYWYRRAGRPAATTSLEAEWAAIALALLAEP